MLGQNAKFKMHLHLLVLLLACAFNSSGTTYYIDCESGNDSNSGTATDSAWRSLLNAQEAKLNPGDSILLSKGCIWNESLLITNGGTSENHIVISSYGSNASPPILRGTRSRRFSYSATLPDNFPNQVFIDDQLFVGSCDSKEATLASKFGVTPDDRTSIEVDYPEHKNGIVLRGDYIELKGITVERYRNVGIKIFGKNCCIDNCQINDIPKTGMQFILSDSSIVTNTRFSNIGFDSNPCCKGPECGHLGNGIFIALDKAENTFTQNIRILNNTFERIGSFSGDHGVYDNGHNTIYINNSFSNCIGTGIKLDGEKAFVFNNRLDSCITAGILIDGGSNHEIVNNELSNCGFYSRNWGRQGAIWYVEETEQKHKHPTPGGADIRLNKIIGGDIGLKVSNTSNNLVLENNQFSSQKIRISNKRPLAEKLKRTDTATSTKAFRSKLFSGYNEEISINREEAKIGIIQHLRSAHFDH